jgi:hypothetical protein
MLLEKERSNLHMDKKLDTLILRLELKVQIRSILNTICHFHLLCLSVARPGMFGFQAMEISIRYLIEVHVSLTVCPMFIHYHRPEILQYHGFDSNHLRQYKYDHDSGRFS